MSNRDLGGKHRFVKQLRRFVVAVLKLSPVWVAGIAIAMLGAEACYRNALIDPYRAELERYNSHAVLQGSDRPAVLCMGDSLTAGEWSWPTFLRDARPDLRVINSGVPGTGIIQASLIAPRRFDEFRPDVFIYQINVTNDLLNLRFPVNWGELSFGRNVYWTLSHRFRSLEFLNYRAGQAAFAFKHRGYVPEPRSSEPRGCGWPTLEFTPSLYNGRVRKYIEAEPKLVVDHLLAQGGRAAEYQELLERLDSLLRLCQGPECAAYVMVVPHAVQVEATLKANFESMGAEFNFSDVLHADTYPFLDGIRAVVARHAGASVIDPLDELRREARDGNHVYFRDDPHLNECGHKLMSQAVARALRSAAAVGRE